MFCSHCGIQLPEGRRVCDQCGPQQVAPVEPVMAPGVHPACHVVAGLVGFKVALHLLSLWQIAAFLVSQPSRFKTTRFGFLMFPVPVHVYLMLNMALLMTTVVCVIGLYSGNRKAWAVLLGLRALFLPFSLYGLYTFASSVLMRSGALGSSFPLLYSTLWSFSGPLLDVVVLVLLLKYKRRLVR